jgi:hypothetical protein
MTAKRIETLTWVLIYGGLIGLIVGWFLGPRQGPWGEVLMSAGAVATAVGVVMIFLRARMKG